MGDFQPKRFQRGGGKREVTSLSVETSTPTTAEVDATDSARAYAGQHGIDLNSISGTGSGGRITKDDVVAAHAPVEVEPAHDETVEPSILDTL